MDGVKTKDELKVVADKILKELKKEKLVIWQAKEVLVFVKETIDSEVLE